jgi:hypothetical protein
MDLNCLIASWHFMALAFSHISDGEKKVGEQGYF